MGKFTDFKFPFTPFTFTFLLAFPFTPFTFISGAVPVQVRERRLKFTFTNGVHHKMFFSFKTCFSKKKHVFLQRNIFYIPMIISNNQEKRRSCKWTESERISVPVHAHFSVPIHKNCRSPFTPFSSRTEQSLWTEPFTRSFCPCVRHTGKRTWNKRL